MPKILIVEDNEDNWQILSRRLRRRGYDVVIARDGKQGLAMAKSDRPDLVLMDMNLPLLVVGGGSGQLKGGRHLEYPVDTPMTRVLHSPEFRQSYTDAIPMNRYGTPEDIAAAVAYLASDGAAYVTGIVIPIDGGFLASGAR